MIKQILRVTAAGILAGIALFLMPLLLVRILVILIIIRLIFRLVGGDRRRGRGGRWGARFYPAFSRYWQHMSEEEKKSFREKIENGFFDRANEKA